MHVSVYLCFTHMACMHRESAVCYRMWHEQHTCVFAFTKSICWSILHTHGRMWHGRGSRAFAFAVYIWWSISYTDGMHAWRDTHECFSHSVMMCIADVLETLQRHSFDTGNFTLSLSPLWLSLSHPTSSPSPSVHHSLYLSLSRTHTRTGKCWHSKTFPSSSLTLYCKSSHCTRRYEVPESRHFSQRVDTSLLQVSFLYL